MFKISNPLNLKEKILKKKKDTHVALKPMENFMVS